MGARLDEAELAPERYATFAELFGRRLRPGARIVQAAPGTLIAPCDGTFAAAGQVAAGQLVQAKGQSYRLADLLADEPATAALGERPSYLTIYLAPRDYHRVHAPCDGRLLGWDYVPGQLYPVNPVLARHVDGIFARNERVVLHFDSEVGRLAVVLVGAMGVGNMVLPFGAGESRTLRGRGARRVRHDGRAVARGDELGAFQLGSTVVLVMESDRVELGDVAPGAPARLGQPIGVRRSSDHAGQGQAEGRGDAAA